MSYAHAFNTVRIVAEDKELSKNGKLVAEICGNLALNIPQLVSKTRLKEYSIAWDTSEKMVLNILKYESKVAIKALKAILKVYKTPEFQGSLVYRKDPVINCLDVVKTARKHVKKRLKELKK